MKCLIGDGVSVDILRDDLTCVDIIEQKLSSGGREVGSCSISTFYIQFCQQYFGYMCWFSGNFNISFICLQDSDDAFYIVDLADILLKHKKWVSLLPRVEPFYGKFSKIPEGICNIVKGFCLDYWLVLHEYWFSEKLDQLEKLDTSNILWDNLEQL